MDREIKRVPNGRFYLVPASAETRGHGTTGDAKFWKHLLPELLTARSRRVSGRYRFVGATAFILASIEE